jgi:hypothetical protein
MFTCYQLFTKKITGRNTCGKIAEKGRAFFTEKAKGHKERGREEERKAHTNIIT